ncbi:MAG TPA: FAD-dependent oxidoreductase [Euzebya sp.]|nr:FAD-dependent oxidoreductase [Euzebya sp.]
MATTKGGTSSTIRTAHTPTSVSGHPLAGDISADVVVVGAGIVGVTTAVQLAARGADVALVTADHVGDGVTGRSTAKVTALHRLVYADLVQRHGQTAAAIYAAANSAAVSWLRDAAGPVWQERVAVTVARDAEEERQLRREADAAVAAGVPVTVEDHVEDWPEPVLGLRLGGQGQVDPVALLNHMLASAGKGLKVFPRTRVTGLRERPGGAGVKAAAGSAHANHVVIATGMPIFDRSGFFALCEPSASYVVALEHPSGPSSGEGDMMITAGDPTRSVRWATDALTGRQVILVGGEGHRTGVGSPTTPRYDRLEAWARDRFEGLGAVVARWSAEDFMSPDRLPSAGPHLRFGGPVHVVTGLSKWGFTSGVASATALVERIDGGGVTDFGRLVDTARLPGLRGMGTVVQSNAEVARHMTTGWVRALASSAAGEPAEGEGIVGRRRGRPRATCRVDGTVHDVSAVCRHLGGIVQWNDGDQTWDCPLHGSRFHADGAVRHGPSIRGLDEHPNAG